MFVLTLVHGTWGRGMIRPSGDAPWTADSSTLCRSLRERLGPDVVFRRFRWSGRNSHTARSDAAGKLRRCLQKGLEEWPGATHVVVAHSHGGNVALMALEDPSLRERIAGIACLATPFISARERDIGRNRITILASATLVPAALFVWVLNALIPTTWNNLERRTFEVLAGSVLMAVFLQLLSVAIARAASLRRELTPRPPERDKLLIIRSTGDEPSGALAIFEFVSEITVRLFLAVQSWGARFEGLATKWASNKRKVLMVSLGAFVLQFPFLFCYAETSIHGSTASWLSKAALIGWGISILVSAGAIYLVLPFIGPEGVTTPLHLLRSALLWPVIVLLSLLLVFPFGWQVAVANILLDVTTETTPPGSWEINLIEPPTSEELGVPVLPLMHMAYENPQVLTKLGKWIEARGVNI